MANRLSRLRIEEVSACKAGANPGAKVVFFKHDSMAKELPDLTRVSVELAGARASVTSRLEKALTFGDALGYQRYGQIMDEFHKMVWAVYDTVGSIISDADVNDKNEKIDAALASFTATVDKAMPRWLEGVVGKGVSMPIKLEDFLKSIDRPELSGKIEVPKDLLPVFEAAFHKLGETYGVVLQKNAELETERKKRTGSPMTEDELLAKALAEVPESLRRLLSKQLEHGQNLEREVTALRKSRVKEEWIAKSKFAAIPKSEREIGDLLSKIAEHSADLAIETHALLQACDEVAKRGKPTEPVGKGGESGDGASAWTQIEKMAHELRGKEPKLTLEKALAKVIEENPKLYSEYLAEVTAAE